MRGETTWSEFEIIARFFGSIQKSLPGEVITGIGDDAAVLIPDGKGPLLATHDMMVEGVHFKREWMPPDLLARKLVKVNVSDIAAMGGIPQYGLLSLALPDLLEKGWLEAFSRGLKEAFKEFNLSLVGGDTSQSPGPVLVALTLLGKGGEGPPVLRHHPQVGDTLYVSGTLGDATLGLMLLNQGKSRSRATSDEAFLMQRHLDPTPRLGLGREISTKRLASAMIDISDGLIADLGHLLEDTSMGAEISMEALPLSEPFQRVAPRLHATPEELALSGGEDYELLFSSPLPPEELSLSVSPPVTRIGKITETPGIKALRQGTPVSLSVTGFKHYFHQKG